MKLVKKEKREKRPARDRKLMKQRFYAGGYSVLATVIIIAIAVMANLMISSLPEDKVQLDLTDQSIYTLSDQTKRIAQSLDEDVNLYLLATSGYEDETITRLLKRYQALSDHIKVEYVDPTQKPTFLDHYDLDLSRLYANSVLVECGSRVRLVGYDEIFVTSYSMDYYSYNYTSTTSFDGENALTNAIHYVSSDNIPKIYTLTGHGEAELSSSITTLVERDNMETATLSLLMIESVPEDASAIVINVPEKDLSEDEADKLIAYLQDGGRVVLITGVMTEADRPNLLRVTQTMGLTIGEGIIVESDANMHVNRYPYYLLPDIASHEITDPLREGGYYVLAPLAQPIVKVEDTGASVTMLLETSDEAYAKIAGLDMTTTEKEDGDTDGPFSVAAISELNEGRLVWIASEDILNDSVDQMVAGANSDLFMNSVEYMCDQAETISIRSKSLDTQGLTLTSAQTSFWSVLLVGVIPAAFLVIGVVIVVRRKRR